MTLLNRLFLFALCGFMSISCFAVSQKDVPAALKPWQSWVLTDDEDLQCPFINGASYSNKQNHICAWPSELSIDASDTKAQFQQSWQVMIESLVPLPGDKQHWPTSVTVNGKNWPIINHENKPHLNLNPGHHQIVGKLNWPQLPKVLSLAKSTHIVKLKVDNDQIAFPKIERHQLWFDQQAEPTTGQDSETLEVVRKISDGELLKLETLIYLDISGKAREVNFGQVLPQGFELAGITSALDAFMNAKGELYALVKPGDWSIKIISYAQPTTLSWQRPSSSTIWPKQEMWALEANEKLRTGKLEGVNLTDNSQADMPSSWEKLPSYLVSENAKLVYVIQHRGSPTHLENQLTLKRQLWLAFDEQTFTFSDAITGNMRSDWRMDMAKPYVLNSARDNDGPILVTQSNKHTGIETRYPKVNIQAQGQLTKNSTIPVTGWQDNFDSVDIKLHLPPATMLLAAFGVDHASGSWLGKWTIWVSFLVLICTVMTWKVIGKSEAMVTFVLLLLIFHDKAAPIVSIINFIIASAIYRFQPFEKLQSVSRNYWVLSSAIVFISLLYFSAIQLKSTIYPQITHSHNVKLQHASSLTSHPIKQTQSEQYTKERRNTAALQARPMADSVERVQVSGSRIKQVDMLERYQADTQIQAGMGVPNWRWEQHTINWQSNVTEGQTFNLYILSGYSYLAVKLAGIIMALLWLAVVLRKEALLFVEKLKNQTQLKASEANSILAIVLSASLLSLTSTTSEAQDFPEKWMLDELHTKLIQDPDCAPRCASINHLQVETHKQQLTLTLEVHAAHDSAVAIPSSPFWFVQGVDINGKSSNLLTRKEGKTYLPIKPGITDVKLIGTIAAMESFQLRFIDKPLNVKVIKDDNWQIVGTLDNRLVSNTLEFTAVSPKQHQSQQSRYAIKPLVKIHRRLSLDNEWSVFTSIERVAPTTGAINLSVPLLATERVLSDGVNVEQHQIKINIPAGSNRITWRSKISRSNEIKLSAKANSGFVEHWSFIITPTYHAAFTGLPNVIKQQDNSDYYQYHFYPLPDETLTVAIERPQAVKGGTLAIDSVKQVLDQGLRSSTLTLDFAYRSTQGGEHTIALPQDFELKQVEHDNKLINIQTVQGNLTLPISPKEHRYRITLRSSASINPWLTSPEVNLNAPISNIETRLNVGSGRWILWADGPTLGPAVLYWGELLAFILVALVLTRIPFSPLSTVAWIILGLGLSLNNWGFLILLFVWFSALSASQYRPQTLSRSWFNLTQLLLFGLSAIVILNLIAIIPLSLLGSPNMGIMTYAGSYQPLSWFLDQSTGELPQVKIVSISNIWYKLIMLIWVLWLCFSCLNWIKWAWHKLGTQGFWKSPEKRVLNQKTPNNDKT